MRQLTIEAPRGRGKEVIEIAQKHEGVNLAILEGKNGEGKPIDVVMVNLPNRKVEDVLDQLQPIPNIHINLIPRGVLSLKPPPEETPQKVTEVRNLSPIEVFLQGLQSIGSWSGFLSYAAVAGVVVWIGLYTNTVFLLTASMLIAPFASPAMNTAIATARGDKILLWRSLLRYFSALSVTISVTAILSFILQQEVATSLMVATSEISSVSVFLPLAAGFAGALNLVQSERSSLVAGAAIGVLVAASLAPPAGLVGMALVLTRWEMVKSAIFLLLLQLFGINFSAALVFRLHGLTPTGARYKRGKQWVFLTSLGVTVAALMGLLTWQFSDTPNLQRSTRSQYAYAEIQQVINDSDLVYLVNAEVEFTRPDIQGQNTLLCMIYVQRREGVELSEEVIKSRLSSLIRQQLLEQGFEVTPLINITIFDPPTPFP